MGEAGTKMPHRARDGPMGLCHALKGIKKEEPNHHERLVFQPHPTTTKGEAVKGLAIAVNSFVTNPTSLRKEGGSLKPPRVV